MLNQIKKTEWAPPLDSLPTDPQDEIIYLLPTRHPAGTDKSGIPYYSDSIRYLPKLARPKGIPIEFSKSGEDRVFLAEYSVDPISLTIVIAVTQMINPWLILAVDFFLTTKAKEYDLNEEEINNCNLKVNIAELNPKSIRGIEIEGKSEDVLKAIKEITSGLPDE